MSYNGKTFSGVIESGTWVVNGARYVSPSAAASARAGVSLNGWIYWKAQLPGTARWRFHSWMDALTQFVAYANAQDARPPNAAEAASGHRTSRDPSLRMRFRVLKRANFSCRACGTSPALRPGLSLHVDHIKAWSLGGETVDENLQTLCEPCNLGKSNAL